LANGSKHFDKLSAKNQSLKSTGSRGGWFAPGYFASNYFARGYFAEPTLIVELKGKAESKYGSRVTALFLAEELVKFWSAPGKVSP
jgi:hypothetical protein